MIERRERIPAAEVIEPKRWKMPYWTEPESVIKAREEAEAETVVEEEEIEVEPLTAEQLELIRQEAYNEGLEQGLIEGRQNGEKVGRKEGHAEGLKSGQEEGHKLGYETGHKEGESKAQAQGEKETALEIANLQVIIKQLSEEFSQHKNTLEDVLPNLVEQLASAVVTEELSQGSEHIVALVNAALDALPMDKSQLQIEINPADLPFLEAVFEQSEWSGQLKADEKIEAGGCRLHTTHSVADFTLSERWATLIKQYKSQLQMGLMQAEPDPAEEPVKESTEATEATEADTDTQTQESSSDTLKNENPEALKNSSVDDPEALPQDVPSEVPPEASGLAPTDLPNQDSPEIMPDIDTPHPENPEIPSQQSTDVTTDNKTTDKPENEQ